MATISMELELLNNICHTCNCMINGKPVEKITEEDIKSDSDIKIEPKYKPVPLNTRYQNPQDNQTNEV